MELLKIVSKIRKGFEAHTFKKAKLAYLYKQYNPTIKDLDGFIEKSYSLFPRLNCGITSVLLKDYFRKGRIIRGKYNGYNHSFYALSKNTIIDITADQFGGPKIYIGPLQIPWTID